MLYDKWKPQGAGKAPEEMDLMLVLRGNEARRGKGPRGKRQHEQRWGGQQSGQTGETLFVPVPGQEAVEDRQQKAFTQTNTVGKQGTGLWIWTRHQHQVPPGKTAPWKGPPPPLPPPPGTRELLPRWPAALSSPGELLPQWKASWTTNRHIWVLILAPPLRGWETLNKSLVLPPSHISTPERRGLFEAFSETPSGSRALTLTGDEICLLVFRSNMWLALAWRMMWGSQKQNQWE